MAFRRKIRERKPLCTIYQCENVAVKRCGVCHNLLCGDCARGHIATHAQRHMKDQAYKIAALKKHEVTC